MSPNGLMMIYIYRYDIDHVLFPRESRCAGPTCWSPMKNALKKKQLGSCIVYTLLETNSSHLKMGAPWKRRFLRKPSFLGAMLVSGGVPSFDFLPWRKICYFNEWMFLSIAIFKRVTCLGFKDAAFGGGWHHSDIRSKNDLVLASGQCQYPFQKLHNK